jgi:hypothetical protein
MRKNFIKKFAGLLIAVLFFQPFHVRAAANRKQSVLVTPVIDESSGDYVLKISELISTGLSLSEEFEIIPYDRARDVISYNLEKTHYGEGLKSAVEMIEAGKRHFFNFRYEDALKNLSDAVASLENLDFEPGVGPSREDALLSMALVYKSKGKTAEAKKCVAMALAKNPSLAIPAGEYPPSMVSMLSEIKGERVADLGELYVTSKPDMAEVRINGLFQGTTPLRLSEIPAGEYVLGISAGRYEPFEMRVKIEPLKTVKISKKLRYASDGAEKIAIHGEGVRGLVDFGLGFADAAKADKVVLVSADIAGGAAVISARVIERKFRTGQVPVKIQIAKMGDESASALAAGIAVIAEGLRRDVSINPNYETDPLGMGEPALLERRKRKWFLSPYFWGAVGVAAAGAVAGGVAAAMSESSPAAGSVRIQFK